MNETDAREDIRNLLRRADVMRVAPGLVDRCDDYVIETLFFAINEALVCGHRAVDPAHLLVAALRHTPAGQLTQPGLFDAQKLCDDVLRRAHLSIPVSQEQLDLGIALRIDLAGAPRSVAMTANSSVWRESAGVDQAATIEALGVAVAARVPVLLWGAPGTGKTAAINAMARAMDWPCETVIASIREPSDFAGLPIVGDDDVAFAPPLWAKRLVAAGRGLLFLDEISTAPPAVQAALLRVVLERVVGDLALPDEVVVVAAANPPEQAADGWDLSAPLANRFCHLDWTVDAQGVSDGMALGWAPPVVPDLAPDWELALARDRGMVAAFLPVRPMLTCAVPRDGSAAGRGWPSPRTWEMAARLLTACNAAEASSGVRMALVTGAVGEGAGVEFLSWLIEMDLPDPEAVLADPGSFVLPERGDRAYAVLAAVAAAVAADATPHRWLAGWKVLARAGERAPDVAAMAARMLAACRPDGTPAPPEVAAFAPLLKAARLL